MKNIPPASTVDAPSINKEQSKSLLEFAEGVHARKSNGRMIDCPYSITKASEKEGRMLNGAEYRVNYENRFQAWMFGFNSQDH